MPIRNYQAVIESVAKTHWAKFPDKLRRLYDLEDLVQEGNIVLLQTRNTWDPGKAASFDTYFTRALHIVYMQILYRNVAIQKRSIHRIVHIEPSEYETKGHEVQQGKYRWEAGTRMMIVPPTEIAPEIAIVERQATLMSLARQLPDARMRAIVRRLSGYLDGSLLPTSSITQIAKSVGLSLVLLRQGIAIAHSTLKYSQKRGDAQCSK